MRVGAVILLVVYRAQLQVGLQLSVRAFYLVFPKFQMAPDFDWTLDTESAQPFSATALKDYCAKNQLLFYVAIVEDSDEYDAKVK